MTEEERERHWLKIKNDALRAKQLSDAEYAKKYSEQMALAYPDSAPRNLWDEFVYRNMTTSNWAGVPENRMNNASIWAEKEIIEQENARAAAAVAAEEAAKFDAKWGQVDQQTWTPGLGAPYHQPKVVEEEVNQGVTGIAPPTEFNFSQGKQLSDADAGAIYSQPLQTNAEIAEHGLGNTGFLDSKASYGYMDVGEMLGRLHYNEDGTFSRLPTVGTGLGDAVSDFSRAAYENSIAPYAFMEKMDGTSPIGPGDWAADQLNRIEADREYNLPENVEARAVAKRREEMHQAGLLVDEQLDKIEADRAAAEAEEMRLAGIWATDEIVRQETEQLAAKRAAEEAKKQRLAAIQSGIDADAGRTTEENYELSAGIVREPYIEEITVEEDILPAVDGTLKKLTDDEKNDKYVEATLNGETLLGKFLDIIGVLDNDNDGVSQEKGNEIVNDIAKIAGQESAAEVEQSGGGVLVDTDDTKTNTKTNTNTSTTGTSSSVTIPSLMTTTSDDGMGGFTMDRLMNPLSPENKKWWMGGGGGVPGSNRAVQFFEALAYIGTPLKYRPAKTPGQQNIDNQITHMNNLMDYQSSMASSSASANQNTFTKLKAAIPSTADLEKSLAPAFYDNAGMFEGDSETKRKIQARAYELHEKMTILASQGIYPTLERVYADEAKAEEERKLAEERRKIEEQKNNTTPVNEESWWSDLWPFN